MHELYELKEKLMKELEEYGKQDLTAGSLEVVEFCTIVLGLADLTVLFLLSPAPNVSISFFDSDFND